MAVSQQARNEALATLGDIDTYTNKAAYEALKRQNEANYNTNKKTVEDSWNTLQTNIGNQRIAARKDFTSGRGTIQNDYYGSIRGRNARDLGARGVSNGAYGLRNFVSKNQADNYTSNLANKFYNTNDELDLTFNEGQNTYNTNLERAYNDYVLANAQADAAQAERENNYRLQLANLANQIQSRMDTASYYSSQLKQQSEDLKLKQLKAALDYAGYGNAKTKDKGGALRSAVEAYAQMNKLGNNYNFSNLLNDFVAYSPYLGYNFESDMNSALKSLSSGTKNTSSDYNKFRTTTRGHTYNGR